MPYAFDSSDCSRDSAVVCAIRVGRETRTWSPGSCFVFDDTQEHEAWNRAASTRVVLLFDFKRDQDLTFWMKNTPLPLDMIFIGKG